MNFNTLSWLCGAGAIFISSSALAQGAQGQAPAPAGSNAAVPGTTAGDCTTAGGASTAPSDNIAASQGVAPAPSRQDDSNTLNEIVVTAQRRAQNLLSVPVSISALTGQQLVKSGTQNISSLQFTTPDLVPSEGFGYTQVYIRGIGNNIYVGADPSIATYIDDVPRIYGSLVDNLVNVDRVEVLKGAQGGLYGRNATGGVVNIITRQPSDKFEADGRFSYGDMSTLQAAGYVNVPLTDSIALNLSAERDTHGYYYKNLTTKNPYSASNFPSGSAVGTSQQTADFFNSGVNPQSGVGRQDFYALSSDLRIKLGSRLKITVALDYNDKDDDLGNQEYNSTPGLAQGTATYLFNAFGVNAQLPPGFFKGTDQKFAVYKAFPTKAGLLDYGVSTTAVLSLPNVDVTSISAYREQKTTYFDDGGDDNAPILIEDVNNHKHFFYQELRAVSTNSGRFHFLAGGTYLNSTIDDSTIISYLPPFPLGPPTLSTDVVENYSIYGQVGYDITRDLNLTVSGRYIHETNNAVFTSPVSSAAALTEQKFLPSATLSYKLGGGNVYARYAEGFKAGGINLTVPPSSFPTNFGKVFAPETVNTYEVGYRAPLFDRKVQLTTAAFYNDYKDLQTETNGNADNPAIVLAIVNAGKARTYGAEESLTWRVLRPLTVGANAGYLDAKYTQFANADGSVLNTFNFSGDRMIFSPKWQVGLTGDVDQPITDRFRFISSLLVSYLTRYTFYNAANGFPDPAQNAYVLTNFRVGVRTSDDRYQVSLFANNLFDTGYRTVANASGVGTVFGWGNPRVVGGELQAKF